MKRISAALVLLFLCTAIWTEAWAQSPATPASPAGVQVVPNDPAQNPLQASGTISAGLSDTLDSSVRLHVSVSNPTMEPVTFLGAKAIFVEGSQEQGHPLFADRLQPGPLQPGTTTTLRFKFANQDKIQQVSAYVLLKFVAEGTERWTALFISGPQQANLADRWEKKFFPYGHYTGFFSTDEYVQAPYWGDWSTFSPYWWW